MGVVGPPFFRARGSRRRYHIIMEAPEKMPPKRHRANTTAQTSSAKMGFAQSKPFAFERDFVSQKRPPSASMRSRKTIAAQPPDPPASASATTLGADAETTCYHHARAILTEGKSGLGATPESD